MYLHLLQCSTTCGTGVQQRKVVCRLGHGKIVPNELCIGSKKPRSEKKCGSGDCSEFMWRTGDWSEVNFCLCISLVKNLNFEIPWFNLNNA